MSKQKNKTISSNAKFLRKTKLLFARPKIRKTIITFAVLMGIFYSAPIWNPILFPPVSQPHIGVSFSQKRSMELGLDWRANYLALLDDMSFRSFRLMSYWDVHEQTRGQFDFSSLDWQMDQAAKRGAKVSLAIGLRQPRWPECHQPKWAGEISGDEWKQSLYSYMEVVVKRYENHPALESWQLENEAVNNWFGKCDKPDVGRLNEEFSLVKKWSKKPIWMSLSDQHGLPFNAPDPDKYGFSVYRTLWSEKTGPYKGYITYPTPIWYHRARAAIIKFTKGKEIFIHELQLEPWGPSDTKNLSIAEQDKSMSLSQIKESVHFARMIGSQDIYTWGGEWWYWRKTVLNDPSVWDTVKKEFSRN